MIGKLILVFATVVASVAAQLLIGSNLHTLLWG